MDTVDHSDDVVHEQTTIPIENEDQSNNANSDSTTDDGNTPEPSKSPEQLEIDRLSSIVTNQTTEISDLNARLAACQQHYETILTRQKDEYSREKQSTVMRYAQAEKAKLDSDKRCENLTSKNNELVKDKEHLQMKLSEFKLMNSKLQQAYENKLSELTAVRKDLDKSKELNQSMDATLKSTLNHFKGESSQLKEQREINERLKRDLQEQKEINEQLNSQCKQLTEAVQSIPTDDERTRVFNELLNEHNALKDQYHHVQEENGRLRDKLKSVGEDRFALENVIDNFRQNALKEKENTKKLYDDLLAAREKDDIELSRLKQIENLYNQTLADNVDLRQLLEKEHQFLQLTQTLTEKNSILQSDYEQIQHSLQQKSSEYDKLIKVDHVQKQNLIQFEETEKLLRGELKQLEEKYQILNRSYQDILKTNEDTQVEIVALKKKHQANTKDLIKQLQQLQKVKLINQDDGNSPTIISSNQVKPVSHKENVVDNVSNRGSRTNSICSLNETTPSPSSQDQSLLTSSSQPVVPPITNEDEQEVVVNIIDIDRQKLIDKLIKQQKLLVRRNEKIEFLNDHIQLLTQDLQNKRKIIQSYAMNEDGFMYTSNESDTMRQQLGHKTRNNSSSLMATLYNRATTAGNQATNKIFPNLFPDQSQSMTLETALDIMGKLQSVLEDTLLKNLTLKENVDTLSKEIERLSKRTKH